MTNTLSDLGRRERQIMDIVIRRGRASAAQVLADLPDPPSYSSVRSMLKLLEEKGHLVHEWDGPRHAYRPTGSSAGRSVESTSNSTLPISRRTSPPSDCASLALRTRFSKTN